MNEKTPHGDEAPTRQNEQNRTIEHFEVMIDGRRKWHVDSGFAEYDAAHAVAGALLAGAKTVEVRREGGESE